MQVDTEVQQKQSVQAKLAALAERASKGQTNDPKALTQASSKNARLPASITTADGRPVGAKAPSGKKRQVSSKQKKKGDKMKERAVGANEQLSNKVMQREARKVCLVDDCHFL